MNKTILRQIAGLARRKLPRHDETFKHFSFVVRDGKVVGWGFNRGTGKSEKHLGLHPFSKIHAEVMALTRAMGDTIVNVRLNSFGEVRNSAPCEKCQKILRKRGVKKVYWMSDINEWEIVHL